MAWSLVCPASRGIGFHLTRHLLQTTTIPIVATARKDTEGVRKSLLSDLPDIDPKRLTVLEVDVTDESTIRNAAAHTKALFPSPTHHLRLAFCMPGILHVEKSPAQLSHAHLTQTFAVNTIGPLLLFKHFSSFLPTRRTPLALAPAPAPTKERASTALPAHAVWLNMAARVGSTSDNVLGGWYSYRASKAGVVSATRGEDVWVRARAADRAMVVAYHPGTVRTGLSEGFWATVPEGKLFGVEDAVRMMVGVVCGLGVAEGRGRCWDWEGKEILP